MSELTTLDERLAEIDERLRALQSGLDESDAASSIRVTAIAPPAVPPPVPAPSAAAPPAAAPPTAADPPAAVAESPAAPPPATDPPAAAAPPPRLREAPAPAPTGEPDDLLAELRQLTAAHERLLELHRELLTQYAELLEHRAGESTTVPVVAGPFADGTALRAFEQDLRELPSVGEVTIREFLGGDRVAVDVRLAGP